jgi:hypothetical protein
VKKGLKAWLTLSLLPSLQCDCFFWTIANMFLHFLRVNKLIQRLAKICQNVLKFASVEANVHQFSNWKDLYCCDKPVINLSTCQSQPLSILVRNPGFGFLVSAAIQSSRNINKEKSEKNSWKTRKALKQLKIMLPSIRRKSC